MKTLRIVFAGGGHAHVYSLRRTADLAAAGYDVVLINPSPHLYYSSMATGVISGRYPPEAHRLDVRSLVESGGGRFIEGKVEQVLPRERILLLEDGRTVPYDAVSFCLGSETRLANADSIPVKPVENLTKIRDAISKNSASNLLVVGGGAAGCEVAANAAPLMPHGKTTLVEAGPDILSFAPKKARHTMREHLRSVGVDVMRGAKAVSFEPGFATLEDGRKVPADIVVSATGVSPSEVFARSGLATGDDGAMWVNHYLQSISDERIFGGGDSVDFRGRALPRFGVYAIRQGPALFRNLRATLEGNPLTEFRPQKTFLYILNLGDGTGLGVYGPLVWRGRSALELKSFIDEKFMDEYRG
ncbi:MAG: FAD-dependent oxidoreductase [Actinomycetota bacterium]|jgi:NADH dehydrogenase FAD-containing subunit|nr:FAD-dependent oxidoreductase [Rubrobacter sp.]MDQ3509639.1 FAD-dependent oxidoreductase [Actinomycetota bacterium]